MSGECPGCGAVGGECYCDKPSNNEMIDAHWQYSGGLIDAVRAGTENEYLYKQAFAHGIKHALEGDVAISNPRACKHCIHYRLNKCLLAMRGVSEDDSCEAFDAK